MSRFLSTAEQASLLSDMYSAHNCALLAASTMPGMGRAKWEKEQKRRAKEQRRCQDALSWYCKAAESGAVMDTEEEAVQAAWAFIPFLVRLMWPAIAEALIKWLWANTR